jgi:hypothetical protein
MPTPSLMSVDNYIGNVMEMDVARKSHYDSPLGGITGYAGGFEDQNPFVPT